MSDQHNRQEEQDFSERMANTASRVWEKTEEWTDAASRFVRLKAAESKLRAEYARLGKYAYRHLRLNTVETENLNESMEKIDALRQTVITLRREIEAEKQAKNARKSGADAVQTTNSQECEDKD